MHQYSSSESSHSVMAVIRSWVDYIFSPNRVRRNPLVEIAGIRLLELASAMPRTAPFRGEPVERVIGPAEIASAVYPLAADSWASEVEERGTASALHEVVYRACHIRVRLHGSIASGSARSRPKCRSAVAIWLTNTGSKPSAGSFYPTVRFSLTLRSRITGCRLSFFFPNNPENIIGFLSDCLRNCLPARDRYHQRLFACPVGGLECDRSCCRTAAFTSDGGGASVGRQSLRPWLERVPHPIAAVARYVASRCSWGTVLGLRWADATHANRRAVRPMRAARKCRSGRPAIPECSMVQLFSHSSMIRWTSRRSETVMVEPLRRPPESGACCSLPRAAPDTMSP